LKLKLNESKKKILNELNNQPKIAPKWEVESINKFKNDIIEAANIIKGDIEKLTQVESIKNKYMALPVIKITPIYKIKYLVNEDIVDRNLEINLYLKTEKSATYQFIICTRNRKKEENIIKTNTFKTGDSSFFNFSGKISKRSIELDDIDRHKKDSIKWDTTNLMEFESFLKMKSSFLSKSQIVLKIELVQVNMLSTTSKGVIEISLDPFENAYSIKGDVHLNNIGTKYNILYLLRIRKGLVNND